MTGLKTSMRAAQFYGPREMKIEDVPIPQPEKGQALVRIARCGICPSDVRAYEGIVRGTPEYPMITGHEWVGEVVALPSVTKNVSVGQRVAVDWHTACGSCYYCRRGYPNYCENLVRRQGGFAEYGIANAQNLRALPESLSYDQAAFCEPLACCINGAESLGVRMGDNVAVMGCGPIGLLHVQLARSAGARVLAIDLLPERLQKAMELGACEAICASDGDPVAQAKTLTCGRGTNATVVTVGEPKILLQAIEMTAATGSVNVFAGFYPDGKINFDFNQIHYRQLSLLGSHNYLPHHFDAALAMMSAGTVNVKGLITHVLPLEGLASGLEVAKDRIGLKVLIAPNGIEKSLA